MKNHYLSCLLLPALLLTGQAAVAQAPTITGLSPARNARSAPLATNVAITFSQPISTSPASLSGLRVFSQQRGGQLRNGAGGVATASGNALTLDPTADFKPGETVYVTSTTAIQATGGARLNRGQVYGFTTSVAGSGRGNFTAPATNPNPAVGEEPHSVALGDVDGDGDLDLLTANASRDGIVSMRLNDGSGNFTAPAVDLVLGDTPFSVALGDVDGDGDLDLLCANYFDNNVSVRLNDGRGKFTAPATNPNPGVGGYPACVVVGDLDGDGDLDLVTANQLGATVSVRLNDGAGNFTAPAVNPNPAVGNGPERVVLGDVDGDGDLDIVNANNDTNTISVLSNDGSGSFTTPAVNLVVGDRPYSVALGDVDGDGDLDLVHTNSDSVIVSVRLNDGSGNFIAQAVNPEADSPRSVALGDVDGDGDLDLLCASSNTVSVRLNDGSGKFTAPAINPNPGVGGRPFYVAPGDLDGDGDLDIVTANFSDNTVSVRLNTPFPLTLTGLSATPNPVCGGSPTTFTATVGNPTGNYSYTLTNGPGVSLTGNASSGSFSQSLTAEGTGSQSFTLTVMTNGGQLVTAVASVTVNAPPTAPIIVTQSGGPYPAGVSSLTISQDAGSVMLTASGCVGGVTTWAGGNSTTLAVSTSTLGTQTYTATCTQNGCASPAATATITVVPATLGVLYRDADYGNTANNIIKPYFQLSNAGNQAIPYGEVTVRYWFTSEGNAPPTNLAVYYAQPGAVSMKYVALAQPRQGAFGYVEYSFAGGGSLGAGGNSGPVENGIQKTDGSGFNELDDYSYQANYANYQPNARITAYRRGTIFWGQEPTPIASQTAVQVYSQARDNTVTSQIQTRVEVRNTGNVALPVAGLRVRYYFTSDNGQTANVYVDYADMGAANVRVRVIRLAAPVSGADSYVELSFPGNAMQLGALSSLGAIDFRLVRSDNGLFDQSNDYSFAANYGTAGLNNRLPAYLNNRLIFGTPPAGAPARIGVGEPASVLSVRVLGNPVVGGRAEVEISGAGGQSVGLTLVDVQGRSVYEQRLEVAGETERVSLPVGQSRGVLLLNVSTATQQQTMKLLRP